MNSSNISNISSPLNNQAVERESTEIISVPTQTELQSGLVVSTVFNNSDETVAQSGNILGWKTPAEIKTENLRFESEQETKIKEESNCDRPKCIMLQKKLSISRGWNRFYKEKLINIDRVLHIISEFENEKRKNLELQLAYDQRSREWTQQQEQLIQLLNEIQPLREKLKTAEDSAAEERKIRQKHQYMEESLKVTIQQLQAKVSQMQTIANPVFVENLDKKLTNSRSENKKIRCHLESSRSEIEELRSYISSIHKQMEKLSKKFFWALQLGCSYGKDLIKETGETSDHLMEWDILQRELEEIKESLKCQYDSFKKSKQEKLKGKRLQLSRIPFFTDWVKDFDNDIMAEESSVKEQLSEGAERQEDEPGTSKGGKRTKRKESSVFDIEDEATQLEKLLSEEPNVPTTMTRESPQKTMKEKNKKLLPPPLPHLSPLSQKRPGRGRGRRRANASFAEDSQSESVCSGGESATPLKPKKRDPSSSNETDSVASSSPQARKRRPRLPKKTEETSTTETQELSSPSKAAVDSSALFSAFLKKKMEMTPIINSSRKRKKNSSSSSEKLSIQTRIRKQLPASSFPKEGQRAVSSSLLSETSSSESDSELRKEVLQKEKNSSGESKTVTSPLSSMISSQMSLAGESGTSNVASVKQKLDWTEETEDEQKVRIIVEEMRISPIGRFSPYPEESKFPSNAESCSRKEGVLHDQKKGRLAKASSVVKTISKMKLSSASLFVPPRVSRVTRYSLRRQMLSESTLESKNEKRLLVEESEEEFKPRRKKKTFALSDTESNSSKEELSLHAQTSFSFTPTHSTANTVSYSKDSSELTQSCSNFPQKSESENITRVESPDFLSRHQLLRSDLSISSSNTDTEENEESLLNIVNPGEGEVFADLCINNKPSPCTTSEKTIKRRNGEETESRNSNTPTSNLKFDMPVLSSETPAVHMESQNVRKKTSEHVSLERWELHSSPITLHVESDLRKADSDKEAPSYLDLLIESPLKLRTADSDEEETSDLDPLNENPKPRIADSGEKRINELDPSNKSPKPKRAASGEEETSDLDLSNENPKPRTADSGEEGTSDLDLSKESSKPRTVDSGDEGTSDLDLSKKSPKTRTVDCGDKGTSDVDPSNESPKPTTVNFVQKGTSDVDPSNESPKPRAADSGEEETSDLDQSNESPKSRTTDSGEEGTSDLHMSNENPKTRTANSCDEGTSDLNLLNESSKLRTVDSGDEGTSDVDPSNESPQPRTANSGEEGTSDVDPSNKSPKPRTVDSGEEGTSDLDQSNESPKSRTADSGEEGTSDLDLSNESFKPRTADSGEEGASNLDQSNERPKPRRANNGKERTGDRNGGNESPKLEETLSFGENSHKSLLIASSPEKRNSSRIKCKLLSLFSDESAAENSPSREGPAMTSVLSSSSPNSLTISPSSSDDGDDTSQSQVEKTFRKRPISPSSSDEETPLVIELNEPQNSNFQSLSWEKVENNSSFSASSTVTSWHSRKTPEMTNSHQSSSLIASRSTAVSSVSAPPTHFQKKQNSTTEPLAPKVDVASWLPSFYKERSEDSPVEESPQILEGIFEDTSEEKTTTDLTDEGNTGVETSVTAEPSRSLPLARSYLFEEEEAQPLGEEEMNSTYLEELFQDIIGTHCGSPEWKNLIIKISKYVSNIPAPNMISKQQPLIRVVLVSILCSSPFEKREQFFAVPPTMYKLFQIVRVMERFQSLPAFTLDTLVNVAAHKLILTKNLRPNSLATLTTWLITSCASQYNHLHPPDDDDRLHWMRSFLIDLLFHHKGLVHEALFAALNTSKRTFIRIVKCRKCTVVERMIMWIAFYGEWVGPKATRTRLIEDLKIKLCQHTSPLEYPEDILNSALKDLTVAEIILDKLAATKAGFYLLLRWVPPVWITKKLFPLLKTVFYDETEAKQELQSVKLMLASMVQEVKWPEDEEKKFLNCLTIFPIVK